MKKPRCSKCHRALTDPFSIAVGMGPECRGGLQRKGWKFPKPKYKIAHGSVIFLGMAGKIEPPNVNESALPNAKAQRRKDKKEESK